MLVKDEWKCSLPGKLVPRATKVIATTLSAKPMVQPKCDATSPITIVKRPIKTIETTKQAQPPQISVGGTIANKSFQNTVMQCIMQSPQVGVLCSSLPLLSSLPLTVKASTNCSFQDDVPTTSARLALTSSLSTVFLNSLLSIMVTSALDTSPYQGKKMKKTSNDGLNHEKAILECLPNTVFQHVVFCQLDKHEKQYFSLKCTMATLNTFCSSPPSCCIQHVIYVYVFFEIHTLAE